MKARTIEAARVDPTQYRTTLNAAIAGDQASAGRLLLELRPRLIAYIQRHLPRELARVIEANDVLQDTQIEAFRRIRTFVDSGDDSFFGWLVTIARRQMLQYLRARRTIKRGHGIKPELSGEFIDELALSSHTPSRSAAGHELAFALETCLQRLPDDYAKAIRLRHIDRLPFSEVATKMQRSERAAQMLCNRGMKLLREQLMSMSRFV